MKIINIEVKNFRLLKDFNLDLASHDNNLAFVNGSNGRGKTTLLTALRWCFFNHSIKPSDFATSRVHELATDATDEISVSVKFQENEIGDFVVVTRKQVVRLLDSERLEFQGKSELTVTKSFANPKIPSEVLPNADSWLESRLPPRFENFFLFDGEKMSHFFDISVKSAIENAVREIAQIDLLEEVVNFLQGQRNRLNDRLGKLSGINSEKLGLKLNEAQRVRTTLELMVKNAKLAEEETSFLKEKLTSELKGYEETSRFLEENKGLRARKQDELDNLRLYEGRISQGLFEAGVLSMIVSRVKYPMQKHIKVAEAAGRYPADFQPRALGLLLQSEVCICQRPLAAGSHEHSAIEKIIQTSINAGELGQELQKIDKGIAASEAKLSGVKAALDQAKGDWIKSNNRVVELNKELDRLAPKLEGVRGNEDYLRTQTKALKDAERSHDDAVRLLEKRKLELVRAVSEVEDAQKKFDKSTANTEEARDLKAKVDFMNRVLIQSRTFNEQILEGVRSRLEDFVSQRFSRVKNGQFKTVITKDFEVVTLDRDGNRAVLSEGENMLKAYIFSIALREVVGLRFPLIVDTPFGRLGEENRVLVAESLCNLVLESPEQQVIFMMHDGEYTPFTKQNFEGAKPFEGFLNWDSDKGLSSLGLGIDPQWFKFTAWKAWSEGVKN